MRPFARHLLLGTTLAGLSLLAAAGGAAAQAPSTDVPVLPVERFTLPNGLTVLLSADHSAPIAAVTVFYHVGSKNELRGHTGFAHLFEHMMFQGSANVPRGQHIKMIEDVGGEMNGTTANDRTLYYETVPVNYLETALWLESDRMGYLLPPLTQEKLDNQREVVKNERRERVDNQPYGSEEEVTIAALFPAANPYSWPVIGSMSDLSAASLDDVRGFFRQYYAPDNAILTIVGDIDTAATHALVDKYFGSIPAGPAIERPVVPAAPLTSEKRLVLEDAKATLPRIEFTWPTVGAGSPDAPALDALGSVLTLDRTSRLTKLLVYDRQLASNVGAYQSSLEDAGSFAISVSPRPGASLSDIERLVDSVVATLTAGPVSEQEVDRAKRYALVGTISGLQSALSRANTLADGQAYYNDPEHYVKELQQGQAVTAADVYRVAKQYLTGGRIVLSMVPAGKLDQASRATVPYVNVTPTPEKAGSR
jgi:zinc protease